MLLMALAIYLLFRPQGLFNGAFNFTHLVSGCTLPQWLVDSMPDALWYASLMCSRYRSIFRAASPVSP